MATKRKAKKTGRPKKVLTPDQMTQLEQLAGLGLTMEDLGDFFGMSDSTLRRRMKEDPIVLQAYKRGVARANARITGTLFQKAVNGNVTALIFWCKTRLQWRTGDGIAKGTVEDEDGRELEFTLDISRPS